MPTLEEKLDVLIAKQDHIKPNEVTLDHIRHLRDENKQENFDFSTRYGGYNRRGGRVLTAVQSRAWINAAYRLLGQYRRSGQ
ncbi:MAG TPA: hypothetical protein VMG40_20345 [Bryobacteraceae bacterium]|nr:hypothetical protein [Bryobacteraceae bacterium]